MSFGMNIRTIVADFPLIFIDPSRRFPPCYLLIAVHADLPCWHGGNLAFSFPGLHFSEFLQLLEPSSDKSASLLRAALPFLLSFSDATLLDAWLLFEIRPFPGSLSFGRAISAVVLIAYSRSFFLSCSQRVLNGEKQFLLSGHDEGRVQGCWQTS